MTPGQIIPEGSVVITPTEMYRELRDTHDEVKALSASMLDISDSLKNVVGDLRASDADHEVRLRALEKLVWRTSGAAAILGAAVSYLINQFAR